jgi:glycosyltransferase involved in cell wall biosynthesis
MTAVTACTQADKPLILAGRGDYKPESPITKYVGAVDVQQRADLMSRAKATFVMTKYIGPFEGVHAESMLFGVPVITTDYGIFPETVINGFNGFRCNTMNEVMFAMKNADKLDRKAIRQWAQQQFSQANIASQYERYFYRLPRL